MMIQVKRWYKGFSYTGNPKELVKQIAEQVHRHNLSKMVPLLRVEKGVKKRTRFYFFLAIESPELGFIPTEVETSLLKLSFFQYPIKDSLSLTYEQIKSMVGMTYDVYDYTHPIPYQPTLNITADNPFELTPSHNISQVDIETCSQNFDVLLYWLSTVGNGTWESFKRTCNALQLEEPKRILRRLRLLGHLESSPDGSRWVAAPSALVQINSHNSEFILCGQRSLNLLQQLEKYASVTSIHQPTGEAPSCIRIAVSHPDMITNNFQITYVGEASIRLAQILPDIATWQQSLRILSGIVVSRWEWRLFDGYNFLPCRYPHQTGLYQMCDKGNRVICTLFYNQSTNTWHQGDWYGLRFLALQYHGMSCQSQYNLASGCLAIPIEQRWFEIYERALVLASGQLPIYQSGWLLYQNVSVELARQLNNKLNVKWEGTFICA